MSKIRVNYKSDLPPVAVKFKINGSVVDVPDHDFIIRFFVDGAPGASFECAHKGDEYINCAKTAADTLTCYINNHKFGCGRLCCEFIDLSADSRYSDKVLKTVTPSCLDVVLVEGIGDDNVELLAAIFNFEPNELASITVVESEDDGGANVVTMTETNGEETSFEVKNGHTGNGIASIVVDEDPTSGENNVVTITETNGTVTVFNVKNGENGVVLDDDPATLIADNLTTNDSEKILSARQGVVLAGMISGEAIRVTIQAASLCTKGGYYNYQTSELTANDAYKYTLIPISHIKRLDVTGCYQSAIHYFDSDKTTKVGRTSTVVVTESEFPSGAVYCGWSYGDQDYVNVSIDYDYEKTLNDSREGIITEQVTTIPLMRGNVGSDGKDTDGDNWLFSVGYIPLCDATGVYIEESNVTYGGVYWYDKDYNFISSKLSTRGVVVPANAKYLRFRIGQYTMGNTYATLHLYNAKAKVDEIINLYNGLKNISPRFLVGKSVAFLGDSITAANRYTTYFGIISGATITNYAVSGKMYAENEIASQAAGLSGNEDIVVMMGGTNDFSQNKAIGDVYSESSGSIIPTSDTSSTCGGLHQAIQAIYTKCPTVQIVIITPPQKSNGWTANSAGKYLHEYADAIKKVAELYGIPVVDHFANCGINPMIPAMKSKYFNNDGTHPNDAYHRLIAKWLYNAIATWVKESY